ncbi:Hypothetical predicted protein [Mytilus galloprovincialis]|uniref:Uncharacterized protein n=1 Tax=Mytilus galloprovincialis TaxID=29158 RepID=A0A8B6BVG3_MYTGA|nr:Hypothetical predicted protein [Mytilus galloprovincialis]
MITPSPERIVWCYKRWQPLFSELQQTIKNILFVQGLPENLNDDSFIDSRYPSLIILDDLMRDVTNSKDVCELFVEGSHHRNLSVACILQNAFSKGKESRTMSINSQYIVLFKNPRDQVGPAIFARQMYPNNPKKFMNKYKEGTQQPYGSLFIDLKQNTPEDDRLKLNIFENKNMIGGGVSEEYISRKELEPPQFEESFQSEQTYLPDEKEIMPSCDDCGVVFESVPDLARHMNKWCPENNDLKRKREFEDEDIPSKKSRVNEIDIEDGEDMAFIKLAELAREANADIWEEKVDKYMDGDMKEDHAMSKANRKLKDEDMDQFLSRYSSLIEYLIQLQNGKLHGKVMKMITGLVNDGMDYEKAIKIAIRKYKTYVGKFSR